MSVNKKAKPRIYDILMLSGKICYSDLGFHDGFAIKAQDIEKWKFEKEGKKRFITDENSNKYVKIADAPDYKGYDEFDNYVLPIVFEAAKNNPKIKIKGSVITLEDKEFRWIEDSTFFENDGTVSLWLKNENGLFALKIDSATAKIFKAEKMEDSMCYTATNELVMEVPLKEFVR